MKSEVTIGDNRLTVTRVFDAPRHLVFDAWKQAYKVQQWWGCKETTKVECEIDFRPGGAFTHKMHIETPEGPCDMTYNGVYDEIVEPERISYHAAFGPVTTRVTVEFIEESGQTRMVLTQEGFPEPSLCKIVSQGTMESFDKLDLLLLRQAA